MKLEFLDKEILYLTAYLKDFPVNSVFEEEEAELAECGYLRKSRSGLTYRLTEKGESIVTQEFEKDKCPLGRGKMLDRRIECSKTILTMYRAGIDVFDNYNPVRFFPAFWLKREKDMILGASQLIGLLITETKTFLVYFAEKDLKIDMEIAAAKRLLPIADAPEDLSVIIMCEEYWYDVESEVAGFPFDVHLIACDDMGAQQLKLLCSSDWHEKLLVKVFENYNQRHHLGGCPCDAIKDGIPKLLTHDMNMTRILRLYRYAVENNQEIHFIGFDETAEGLLYGEDLVKAFCLNEEFVWKTVEINPQLYPDGVTDDA